MYYYPCFCTYSSTKEHLGFSHIWELLVTLERIWCACAFTPNAASGAVRYNSSCAFPPWYNGGKSVNFVF